MKLANSAAEDVFALQIGELCWNVALARERTLSLFDRFDVVGAVDQVLARADIHENCLAIIQNADNIRKLLFNDGPAKSGEYRRSAEWRQGRCAALRALVGNTACPELMNVQVRNRLTHFDEHMDRLTLSLNQAAWQRGDRRPIRAVVYNLAVPSIDALVRLLGEPLDEVAIIRLYLYRERRYIHFDHIYSFDRLLSEIEHLYQQLTRQVPERFSHDGQILLFSDEAFNRRGP